MGTVSSVESVVEREPVHSEVFQFSSVTGTLILERDGAVAFLNIIFQCFRQHE